MAKGSAAPPKLGAKPATEQAQTTSLTLQNPSTCQKTQARVDVGVGAEGKQEERVSLSLRNKPPAHPRTQLLPRRPPLLPQPGR